MVNRLRAGETSVWGLAAAVPLKKPGVVEYIGNTALCFASKEANDVAGQALIVDGGQILPESLEALNSA